MSLNPAFCGVKRFRSLLSKLEANAVRLLGKPLVFRGLYARSQHSKKAVLACS